MKCSTIVHLFLISIYLLMILIYFIPIVIYSIFSKMLIESSVKLACGFVPTLSLNVAKTHFVIFHPHQKKINNSLTIEIDGKPIN